MRHEKEIHYITGMRCAACAAGLQKNLEALDGAEDVAINFANSSMTITYDDSTLPFSKIVKAVEDTGFNILETSDDEDALFQSDKAQEEEYKKLKRNFTWSAIFTLPVFVIGMFFMHAPYANIIMLIFSIPVLFIFGKEFYINAWRGLKRGRADMDTLVALSTGVSFLFSIFNTIYPQFWESKGLESHVYYEAASVIITLILLGRLLEGRAKGSTSSAIKNLMGLQPKEVIRINPDGSEAVVPVKIIQPGDILIVKPGDKIPVDGVVIMGESYVDESMITGEPVPVKKQENNPVYTGTINQKGSFRFRAEKVGSDTLLAQIIKTVREAQGSKAPVQRLVDKIANIFVPIVIGVAILTFIVWSIFGGENSLSYALLTSVTVLVIACPCALGLATPTAIMVGIGKGAENNILIKDAVSLEQMNKMNALILDKTGTITEGRPEVTDFISESAESDITPYLSVLYGMEYLSEHPIAVAIINFLDSKGIDKGEIEDFKSITGEGVKCTLKGIEYMAGNIRIVENNALTITEALSREAEKLIDEYKTTVYFSVGGRVVALLAITDKIKPSSFTAIRDIKDMGVNISMITGDNEKSAAKVAEQVMIDNFRAKALPSDKLGYVKELQNNGYIVGVVGDGINDSEAMAIADVSIAMGKGADIAMDVAQITLITSDLSYIPKAIRLSKITVKAIKQNLFWAFIYNIIGIPIAAGLLYPFTGFLLNPMIAAAAMAFSSVSVVTNSLRIKSKKL